MLKEPDPLEYLKELAKAYGEGQATAILNKIVAKFEKTANKFKLGFSVNSETANYLTNISQRDIFKRLKECIGNKHWALRYCRVGILIEEMSNIGEKIDVDSIKNDSYTKEKKKAVTVINMGTTGVIKDVISYLSRLKSEEDWTQEELIKEFEYLIDKWELITIFVKKTDPIAEIENKIINLAKSRESTFWVFGYSSAVEIAWKSIAKVQNQRKFHEYSYIFFTKNSKDGLGNKKFSCAFKLC